MHFHSVYNFHRLSQSVWQLRGVSAGLLRQVARCVRCGCPMSFGATNANRHQQTAAHTCSNKPHIQRRLIFLCCDIISYNITSHHVDFISSHPISYPLRSYNVCGTAWPASKRCFSPQRFLLLEVISPCGRLGDRQP